MDDSGDRATVASVPMSVLSGRLVVGDVERTADVTMILDVEPGRYLIDAYFDVPLGPESVDLVLRAV
jgi:hypothetical protein